MEKIRLLVRSEHLKSELQVPVEFNGKMATQCYFVITGVAISNKGLAKEKVLLTLIKLDAIFNLKGMKTSPWGINLDLYYGKT